MSDVRLHRQHERFLISTIEQQRLNHLIATQQRRTQPMSTINHPHRLPMHNDRRQPLPNLRQHPTVLDILTRLPRRISRQ